jgi:hypothetical protein
MRALVGESESISLKMARQRFRRARHQLAAAVCIERVEMMDADEGRIASKARFNSSRSSRGRNF